MTQFYGLFFPRLAREKIGMERGRPALNRGDAGLGRMAGLLAREACAGGKLRGRIGSEAAPHRRDRV